MWQLILQVWPRDRVTGIDSGLLCNGTYFQSLRTSHQDAAFIRALKLYRWSASLHHHFYSVLISQPQHRPFCVICLFNWSTWPSVAIELASSLVDVTVSDQCVANINQWHAPNLRKLCLYYYLIMTATKISIHAIHAIDLTCLHWVFWWMLRSSSRTVCFIHWCTRPSRLFVLGQSLRACNISERGYQSIHDLPVLLDNACYHDINSWFIRCMISVYPADYMLWMFWWMLRSTKTDLLDLQCSMSQSSSTSLTVYGNFPCKVTHRCFFGPSLMLSANQHKS
jgi:hypothetical protein